MWLHARLQGPSATNNVLVPLHLCNICNDPSICHACTCNFAVKTSASPCAFQCGNQFFLPQRSIITTFPMFISAFRSSSPLLQPLPCSNSIHLTCHSTLPTSSFNKCRVRFRYRHGLRPISSTPKPAQALLQRQSIPAVLLPFEGAFLG